MGGIAGYISFDNQGQPPGLGRRMADIIGHRGRGSKAGRIVPGRANLWQCGGIPAAMDQGPVLAMDGDIYNRTELSTRFGIPADLPGEEFVLAIYRAFGLDGLAAINGDMAAAVFDPDKNEIILFRDRFGVRPLYYALVRGGCVFASEPKALWAHPELAPLPDGHALFDYLATHYRYIHRDPSRTFYKNVFQVPPAHVAGIGRGGVRLRRYWDLEPDPEIAGLPPEETERRLLELFEDSVTRRLTPDKIMAFSVSSGMDSSSVSAMAARVQGEAPDLYSVSYGFGEYDEAAGIRPLVDELKADWRNIVLTAPPLFETIDRMVRQSDQPVVTVTWLSHYKLAEQARADGKDILFSGLGGDECLAGEYEHFLYFFADLKAAGNEKRLAREVGAWARLHDHPVFKKNWNVVREAFDRLIDFGRPGRVLPDMFRYQAYWPHFDRDFIKTWDRPVSMSNPFMSYLTNRCYQDLFYETTPPCLAADNVNAARFGMATRFPFLDHRLVEFCYSLPGEIKYDHGVTKSVMRRAMEGILPDANRLNTVKTGFNAPAGDWLAGPERDNVFDLINSRSFIERGWLNPGAAQRLFREHLKGTANHMMILWQIINAELWLKSLAESALAEAA